IVDDPADFGRIAAANAISDVYAMGGVPTVALSIVGMPEEVGRDVLVAVLRGASEVAAEAGCAIVGGHSLRDSEPKFGLAVVGSVERGQAWSQRRARAGHALVLTKPLGVGVLAQAARQGNDVPGALAGAVRWMRTLNRRAAELGRRYGATAATDVTGFGLLGSLKHLCEASGVAARIEARAVPLMAHALDAARADQVPGGSRRNARYVAKNLELSPELDPALVLLLSDAQTSGGLLLSLPAESASALVGELGEGSALIGELESGSPGTMRVV
ncbi:MAG TPA: selenide, water dikinase SelD, partial [Polyangiaceae bacterium]|nr:selenide, water dikinase SelD [Polyangiaceae bacterium]